VSTICTECKGTKGPDGKTGYWIHNAYDESKRWLTCEYCGGTGDANNQVVSLTLEEFNMLFNDDAPKC
jgi:hypothetical protein